MAEIRIYDNENKILKDLIETNLRQRGDISSSSLKMGRIIYELERIYGIKNGGDKKSDTTMLDVKTQKDVANEIGIDNMESYRNYRSLLLLFQNFKTW